MRSFTTADEGERVPEREKRKSKRSSYKLDMDALCVCEHQKRKHVGASFTLCGVMFCPCMTFTPQETS